MQRRDRDGCNALFAETLTQCPHYAGLAGADPEGQVFASAPAVSGPVNVADRLWFQKAVQTRAFVVGEPVLGRISKKYSINLAYPILDDAGRLQGVLTASLDLHWLGSLLAKSDFPPSTAMVLTDSTGKVLFRYPEPLQYIGKMLPDVLIKAMTTGDEGVAEGVGLPGDARLFAFARLSPPWQEMCVTIGLPRAWAVGKVNRDLRRNLIWLGLVAILAMAAAWFGAGPVHSPAGQETARSDRTAGGGDLTVRSGARLPGRENWASWPRPSTRWPTPCKSGMPYSRGSSENCNSGFRNCMSAPPNWRRPTRNWRTSPIPCPTTSGRPLRSIGGFARVLLEDYADRLDAEGQRYLQIIHQEARKMGQLIDDLLALARLGRKEMSLVRIDMAELAKAVFEELKAAYPERKLQIDIQPLPAALGDRVMMRQVLANLLHNAIKFTQDRDPALIQVSGWSEGTGKCLLCQRQRGRL